MNIVLTILTHWNSILFDRECEETNQKINSETGGREDINWLKIKSGSLNIIWKFKIREILSYSDPMILSISKTDSKYEFPSSQDKGEKVKRILIFYISEKLTKNEIYISLAWVHMEMNGVFN